MSIKENVWNNAVEVMQAFTPYYQKEAVQKIVDAEALDVWQVLLVARGAEPEPLTMEYLRATNPYASPARLTGRIEQGVADGFLEQKTPGKYRLTVKGYAVLDAFFSTAHASLVHAPTLAEGEMNRLSQLLSRVVQATEAAPQPVQKFSLAGSRWSDPSNGAPAVIKVDQYITDLLRFRDDAHYAAWQPTGVEGVEWETLTFIWNEEANTPDQLAEKLERRGYTAQDCAAVLSSLGERGWLVSQDGEYLLTTEGRRVRDDAEKETDRLFYSGWTLLSAKDLETMHTLLADLNSVLIEGVPVEAVAA